jgi:hypothetical protein
MAYETQPIVVGSTPDFTLKNPRKDGVTWDITGGVATLWLKRPDDTWVSFVAVVDANGAHYQVSSGTLNEAGDWARQWSVTKSGVTAKSRVIEFEVHEAAA